MGCWSPYQAIGAKSAGIHGLSPKLIVRIARYQRAMQMKAAGPKTWIEIAHAVGYHDQMHMIRDFHEFAGGPPTSALQEITSDHLINF